MTSIEDAIEQLLVKNNDGTSTSTAAVGYDCFFVVGPISIGCHRAIVQARSAAIKDVIISESNNADDEYGSILEVNLPDDDAEAIRALVQYCYTNTIPTNCIATLEAVDNLLLVTKKFGLDEVAELCKNLIAALVNQSSLPASMEGKVLAVPNSHLDLTCIIDDKLFSDMIIKTEDEDIHAHKCVLLSRVPSLASEILNDDVIKGVLDMSNRPRMSVKRVMTFLYGDKVAASTQEEVLQDIITAKELHVNELVSKLERIALTHIADDNALDVLKFAMHNGLEDLKNAALDGLANCDYDGLFDSIKRLESSFSSISSEFNDVVRRAEQSRTKQTPQLIQGISLRGCLGLVAASLVSLLLFQLHTDNEFLVAFTNVCFCLTVGFLFL